MLKVKYEDGLLSYQRPVFSINQVGVVNEVAPWRTIVVVFGAINSFADVYDDVQLFFLCQTSYAVQILLCFITYCCVWSENFYWPRCSQRWLRKNDEVDTLVKGLLNEGLLIWIYLLVLCFLWCLSNVQSFDLSLSWHNSPQLLQYNPLVPN